MGFFGFSKPAWASKNETKALKAINEMIDKYVLMHASQESKHLRVRKAAVDKLIYIRKEEIRHLTDQAMLTYIAINDDISDFCTAAVYALTDQTALAEVIKKAKFESVCCIAAYQLNDQSILESILKNKSTGQLALAASNRLKQLRTEKINTMTEDVSVMTDQRKLVDLAINGQDYTICGVALKN